MNRIERDELFAAAAETFPKLRWAGLKRLCAVLDPLLPPGRWRARLGSDVGWEEPEFEFLPGVPGDAVPGAKLRSALAAPRFGGRAPEQSAWFVLSWDARAGRLRSVRARQAAGAAVSETSWRGRRSESRRVWARSSWAATRFATPELGERFMTMARLCPVKESWRAVEKGAAGEWFLRLARPEPWPLFLRLDPAIPFGERGTEHSMLLLGRGVEEIGYRGAELWSVIG